MFASQIVYDAFEPSFKEVAENTHSWVAKKKKKRRSEACQTPNSIMANLDGVSVGQLM